MKLDRELQLKLLNQFAPEYPAWISVEAITKADPVITPNLRYLAEHGLIEGHINNNMGGTQRDFRDVKITAAGLDFLLGDGGLSAILGVVTVKLHDDTIRDLIAARIQDSDLPAEEKTGLLHQLKELRGESIKHLTMKLLDAGLENAPKAIPLIQKALESLMT